MERQERSGEAAERRADSAADRALAQGPVPVRSVAGGDGSPLAAPDRSAMEARLGHDLSRVRIHSDSRAAAFADLVHARAATVGTDVFFAAGEYRPQTPAGQRLLAHELAHAVDPDIPPGTIHRQPQTGTPYDVEPDTLRAMTRWAFRKELIMAIEIVAVGQPGRHLEARGAKYLIGTWLAAVNMAESAATSGMSAVLPATLAGQVSAWVHGYADALRSIIRRVRSVAQGAEELSTVDIDGILDEAGMEADWLALTEMWYFEESPQDLGQWVTNNGRPCVIITRRDYIDDLRSRPAYLEAAEAFRKAYPDPGAVPVGTTFRHDFHFTGPGSASGQYNAVEWFLGSYTLEFTVTAVDPATRTVTVDVVAGNRSRWGSATRLPEEYHRRYGVPTELVPDVPRAAWGPGGDVEQRFMWTDELSY
jgi:Domain of unknown function (DUF4157)